MIERQPSWVHEKISVEGHPVDITLDLSWADVDYADRPPCLVDFGHDFEKPGRDLRGTFFERRSAKRSCKAVEEMVSRESSGAIVVGSHLGLGEIGVLVALPDRDLILPLDNEMSRAWPARGGAYITGGENGEWPRYDRLLQFLCSVNRSSN